MPFSLLLQGLNNKNTGRFQTEDVVPDDAAGDFEFQKAVQQIEDQQHVRAGFLFARGAFDKGDQAYIKEQEERNRHAEEAMHERERAEFMAARARAEAEERRKAEESLARAQQAHKAAAGKKQLEAER